MFYAASRSSILQIAVLAGEPHGRLEIKFDSAQVSFTYKNIVHHSNMTVLHVNDVAGGKAMLRAGNIVCSFDAFVCPKTHFLQMQVSPKRRRVFASHQSRSERKMDIIDKTRSQTHMERRYARSL